MRVLCVKWGDKYSGEWVIKLRNMVERHLTIPHEFVCITDAEVSGITCVPFNTILPTWWAKLNLFEPGRFLGLNLYMDLDVIITSSIDELVYTACNPEFLYMRDDFSYSMRKPKQGLGADFKRLLGGDGCCNSSVMLWHDDACRDVWDRFTPDVMTEMHGDQNYISNIMRTRIGFIPDELVCSYKYHVLRGDKPAPVTVFHGDPKPDALDKSDPLRQAWQ